MEKSIKDMTEEEILRRQLEVLAKASIGGNFTSYEIAQINESISDSVMKIVRIRLLSFLCRIVFLYSVISIIIKIKKIFRSDIR